MGKIALLAFAALAASLCLSRAVRADYAFGPMVGERTVLAVMLNTAAAELPCSRQELQELLTGAAETSLINYYRQASYGRLTFTVTSVGSFEIQSGCPDWAGVAREAGAALEAMGIAKEDFDHIVYFVPPNPSQSCRSNGGYNTPAPAFVVASYVQGYGCYTALVHEVGHGLGMSHARSPDDDYGDNSDIMGTSPYSRFLNAAHGLEMGWIPEERALTVQHSGRYRLAALEQRPDRGRRPFMLRIPLNDSEALFVSHRTDRSFRRTGAGKVWKAAQPFVRRSSVHQVEYSTSHGAPFPRLKPVILATVATRRSYTHPASGVVIRQLGRARRGAVVRVLIPGR